MIKGKYQWNVKHQKNETGKKTEQEIIDKILYDRGIRTEKEKESFLNPSFSQMHDPMILPDMQKAVERIERAKIQGEKITIYGDYDVDGITSTSILYMYLCENGYDVDYYIPDRLSEGYGLNIDALEMIQESGTTLVISVDTGIAAAKEVEYAKGIGLDIIITDHHECQETIPNACAVINPKRPDATYPFTDLAGVGVTFKLIHALAIQNNNIDTIWKYIDIVAIGTVADIVPLVDENRVIVKQAFATIPTTWNIGLAALLEIAGCLNKKLTAGMIGFQIAPRLNATGRLGDAKKGVELFTTGDKKLAYEIASMLDEENKKRQQMEKDIYNCAIEKIEKTIDIQNQKVIVVAGENWHPGVIGIVASRVTELYYKPSIILSIEDGIASGSARSIEGFSMFDALCDAKDYLEKFGGHDMAAGLTLQVERLDDFTRHINEYATVVIDDEMLIRKIQVDEELEKEHITIPVIEALEKLEPYGMGNPTPVFLYKGSVYSAQAMGEQGKHLKIKLYTSDQLIDVVGFQMGELAEVIGQGEEITIVGSLQKNEWLGKISPQFIVKDIQSPRLENAISQYYLSLYKRLPCPQAHDFKNNVLEISETVTLNDITDWSGVLILVHTEQGLKDILTYLENDSKAFTSDVQICYINSCEKNKSSILVNGNPKDIDMSKCNTIIHYEPSWTGESVSNQYINNTYHYHKQQLSSMIPTRDDCIAVYRHCKQLYINGKSQVSIHVLKRELYGYKMTEYKLLQILDVFMELGLISYQLNNDNETILFAIKEGIKTDLKNSTRYVQLQQFATSLLNIC